MVNKITIWCSKNLENLKAIAWARWSYGIRDTIFKRNNTNKSSFTTKPKCCSRGGSIGFFTRTSNRNRVKCHQSNYFEFQFSQGKSLCGFQTCTLVYDLAWGPVSSEWGRIRWRRIFTCRFIRYWEYENEKNIESNVFLQVSSSHWKWPRSPSGRPWRWRSRFQVDSSIVRRSEYEKFHIGCSMFRKISENFSIRMSRIWM